MGLDQAVLHAIVHHRTEWVTALTRTVAVAGMSRAAYPAGLTVVVLIGWGFRVWRPAVAAPVAAVIAVTVAQLAKGVIARPRPPHDLAVLTSAGSAMPSSIGAMTAAAAMPLVLGVLRTSRRLAPVVVVLVTTATVGVGACMVYLGAHWLSDVLAGWILGAAIGAAAFRLIAGPMRRAVVDTR